MADKTKTTIAHTNTSPSPFQQDFARVLRRYRKHCQYIKRLLDETEKSYNEISEKRVLTPDKISEIKLSKSDQEYIDCLSPRPLALIICSQTYNGKARFVNEFLTDSLLPESPIVKKDDIVRMIRIKHHPTTGASLNVSGSFELVGNNGVQQSLSWSTVVYDDIIVNSETDYRPSSNDDDDDDDDEDDETASLEIRKPLDFLGNDLQIIITPTNQKLDLTQVYSQITENIVPIFIYIIDQENLSENDIEELRLFRTIVPNEPILFIRIDQTDLTNGVPSNTDETPCVQIFRQLCDLGFLSLLPPESCDNTSETTSSIFQSDMIDNGLTNFSQLLNYIRKHIDRLTIRAVGILQQSHEHCLDLFNDSAFDMARDILITPKRINYAREKEKDLFESLIALTNSKQNEIQRLILQAVDVMQESLTDQACSLEISGIELTDQLTVKTAKDLKKCTSTIQEFVLVRLNQCIAERLSSSVTILHQDYVGTLTRCLNNLELSKDDDESSLSASQALQEILQSAYQVNISLPTNSNLFKILIDKMKEFFRTFRWSNCPRIDPDFKKSVAINMLHSLSEAK
jgi:receptor-interacting serine/threonine-protein kinase 5